jgi:rhodanese-related sulfurtransferase
MGWELAGYDCERGASRVAQAPSPAGLAKARESANRVAARFGVRFASREQVQAWQRDSQRTLYLLDVRTREEFEALRIAGSRHAAGGQLVQATDEYIGVRNSRVVLVDPAHVRSVMTASWLVQMGWNDVFVLEPEENGDAPRFHGFATESGPRARPSHKEWPTVDQPGAATVIDFSTSLRFRAFHLPGASWAVRARLVEARRQIGAAKEIVLTSEDGVLAHLAAPEAAVLWPEAKVNVLRGGNAAWKSAGGAGEAGIERATTTLDDVWYKPYDHGANVEKHARDYLEWEVALVEQIKRDPAIRFRAF